MESEDKKDWKSQASQIQFAVLGLDEALDRYIELKGKPDRIPVEDPETVLTYTGILTRAGLENFLPELLIMRGYNPEPIDGFYEKYRR